MCRVATLMVPLKQPRACCCVLGDNTVCPGSRAGLEKSQYGGGGSGTCRERWRRPPFRAFFFHVVLRFLVPMPKGPLAGAASPWCMFAWFGRTRLLTLAISFSTLCFRHGKRYCLSSAENPAGPQSPSGANPVTFCRTEVFRDSAARLAATSGHRARPRVSQSQSSTRHKLAACAWAGTNLGKASPLAILFSVPCTPYRMCLLASWSDGEAGDGERRMGWLATRASASQLHHPIPSLWLALCFSSAVLPSCRRRRRFPRPSMFVHRCLPGSPASMKLVSRQNRNASQKATPGRL